jgi:hypothetical protein
MSEKTLQMFRSKAVNRAELEAVLGDRRLRWIYGERMEDVHLEEAHALLNEGPPLDRFATGRAFGQDLEIDWWREEDGYRLRALLEEGSPPAGVDWTKVEESVLVSGGRDEHPLVLWGEYDEKLKAWAEARIPRALRYPVPGDARPKWVTLRVRDYRRDGAVVLTRFLAVEPY